MLGCVLFSLAKSLSVWQFAKEEEQVAVITWEILSSSQITHWPFKDLVFRALKLALPIISDPARASQEANHLELCLQLQKKGK